KVTPLAERNLLDEGYKDVILEPEALLASMVETFNASRDVILSVSRAWESLEPRMAEFRREVRALRDLARGAPTPELAALTEAERELAALESRVQRDPLGALGNI